MSERNYLLKTTQKQYFLRVALEEMSQFKFLFLDDIVDLWNSLSVTIKITVFYLCLVIKFMNFILMSLIQIMKDLCLGYKFPYQSI